MKDHFAKPYIGDVVKLFYKLLLMFSISLLIAVSVGITTKTNQLSLGMTKAQVIQAMGLPMTTRAVNGTEYLTYQLTPGTLVDQGAGCAALGVLTFNQAFALSGPCTGSNPLNFFMQFREGKLVAYGQT